MASTTFVDYSNATPITAAWLNDVNRLQYTILGNPATSADINNVLGIVNAAHAGGTADALTATYTTPPTAFIDGLVYYVRATSANATTTPTFTPNNGVLAATTIVKENGIALLPGDISGAGHWLVLQYDTTLSKWVLLNPATVVAPISPITATVATNALTLGLNPTSVSFRNASPTSGIPNIRSFSTALSLVVPSGATLGTINSVQTRLVLLAIDNAGTVELAVVNISGGVNLDETSLISTTAISAAATANNVIYSTTARTNVPFRVVGFIDITETTAGTWATGPTLVQGSGGQTTSFASIGQGQTLQTVTGSRALGTLYYNNTGKTIAVFVFVSCPSSQNASGYITGTQCWYSNNTAAITSTMQVFLIVPPGGSYQVVGSGASTLQSWFELR